MKHKTQDYPKESGKYQSVFLWQISSLLLPCPLGNSLLDPALCLCSCTKKVLLEVDNTLPCYSTIHVLKISTRHFGEMR